VFSRALSVCVLSFPSVSSDSFKLLLLLPARRKGRGEGENFRSVDGKALLLAVSGSVCPVVSKETMQMRARGGPKRLGRRNVRGRKERN